MVPLVLVDAFGHPDQLAQRQGAGSNADDPGELPEESPGGIGGEPLAFGGEVGFCSSDSASSICFSSSPLSSLVSTAAIAIPVSFLSFSSALDSRRRRSFGKK